MTPDLAALIAEELHAPAPPHAAAMARELAGRFAEAAAVLFYGSVLRTGDLEGVLDFYVLTRRPRAGLRGLAGRLLWPDVSYHEAEVAGRTVRAKVAAMTLAQFEAAARDEGVDTTIWTRFVQPCRLAWSADAEVDAKVAQAVAAAAVTASRYAAALGPARAPPDYFWGALFAQTYAAEFRVEARGRESLILGADPGRYDRVLLAAWAAGGVAFDITADREASPELGPDERDRILRRWRTRRRLGRPLNFARLAKAAFTFEGAARYAAWKIERHTGLAVPLTPWRERHVILASPGVLWRLWQARRKARAS